MSDGNIIRVECDARVGLGGLRIFTLDLLELSGRTFTIASGTWDLISKVTPFAEKVTARALTIDAGGRIFEGSALVTDTDVAGEYLLHCKLTLATGEHVFVVQDWTIGDAKDLAEVA